MRLAGMTAAVTGAASGIGLATAKLMVTEGAKVASLDLWPPEPGPGITAVPADVTDLVSLQRAAGEVGDIDVLVCNAGIASTGTIEDYTDDEWRRVMEVNVLGVARTVKAFLPSMRRSTRASIVITASVAAKVGLPRRACYSASKGAVQALTLALAADLVPEGIRVNCVCPATVDTPWVERLLSASERPDDLRAELVARQPMGRLGTAEEVAEAIVYLASPAAGYTTGTSLVLDGGVTGLSVPPR